MMGWLLWLAACGPDRTVEGAVVDIWGKPIASATVVVEGVVERYYSGADGRFAIVLDENVEVAKLMAGKDGYIREILDVMPGAEEDTFAALTFHLYPEPEQPGFYAVGRDKYIHLGTRRVQLVGTEIQHFTGINEVPEERLPPGTNRFVFTSTLRSSELSRMNLHLSRLRFVDHTSLKGVLGAVPATVNLFVADTEVPFELSSLPSRDDYLITTKEPLKEAGMYAFHAQDVLNETDPRALLNLPKEMQVVFPFEVQ